MEVLAGFDVHDGCHGAGVDWLFFVLLLHRRIIILVIISLMETYLTPIDRNSLN